jgi:hypothetical protein
MYHATLISVDICEGQNIDFCKCGTINTVVPLPPWGKLSVSVEVKIIFTPIANELNHMLGKYFCSGVAGFLLTNNPRHFFRANVSSLMEV